MNKLFIFIVIALILTSAGIFYYSTQGKLNLANLPYPQPSSVQPPAKVSQSSLPKQAQVTITKDGFVPQTLLVKKGTQVTWVNQDKAPHQIVSDPHPTHLTLSALNSDEPLLTNDSFTFTFETVGTFTYHDEKNPLKIKGTIKVE